MKKLIFLAFFTFSCLTTKAQQEEINLQPCLKLCVVLYTDNSGSMDSATTDINRWARRMTLIPAESGYVEVSLYSFDDGYQQWCPPTGNRAVLLNAVKELCSEGPSGGTVPWRGLEEINILLADRRARDPAEIQVLLIHSDYYWNGSSLANDEIKKLLDSGVIVVLSVPRVYDGVRINGYDQTDEVNLFSVEQLGCKNIRSNFGQFKTILEKLEPKVPCG